MVNIRNIVLGCLVLLNTIALGCASSGTSHPAARANLVVSNSILWDRSLEMTAVIGEETIMGEVDTVSLFYFIHPDELFGSKTNEATNIINDANLSSYVETAAAQAVKNANADGIFITRIYKEQSGFWPILFFDTYVVKGRPVTFKVLGPVSEERLDKAR